MIKIDLREMREDKFGTLACAAGAAGVSLSTMSRAELGRLVAPGNLRKIAAIYGLDTSRDGLEAIMPGVHSDNMRRHRRRSRTMKAKRAARAAAAPR